MKFIFAILFLSLIFLGCEYDQDFDFVPKTRAAYLLMAENGQHQLRRVSPEGEILENWGENLGLNNPADIAGNAEELWVSLSAENKLVWIDLETETEKGRYDLGELKAHFLTLGSRYLLLSDTLNKQLGFFHLKKKELTTLKLENSPRKAVYRSAKFFLILDKQLLAIYSEASLAPIETLEFSRPIEDLVLDNRFTTWVYNRDSMMFRTGVSWNTHAFTGPEELAIESKTRYSPYRIKSFGKEYLGQVQLIEGRLSNFPEPLADDFAVDFFEGQTYFIHLDSLRVMQIKPPVFTTLAPFRGTFRNSYFYIAQSDK